MAALQKGVDMLKASLENGEEEKKKHVFVVLGASVSVVLTVYKIPFYSLICPGKWLILCTANL